MEIVVFKNSEEVNQLTIEEFPQDQMRSDVPSEFKTFATKSDFACLAGPQVGINQRFFFMGGKNYFNPFLEEIDDKAVETFEICNNFPDKRIKSVRYPWVELSWHDGTKTVTEKIKGEQAQYVQFCMDWIDGSLGEVVETIRQETVKDVSQVGRNDPCPCGSGKKFKKCCGKVVG